MRNNNNRCTMIELAAGLIIILVITAVIGAKMINLKDNAERKLLGIVLAKINTREHMVWLNCKMSSACAETELDDLIGISFDKKYKNLIFDNGNKYPVYRVDATELSAVRWYEGKKPKK